jgi:probable HAF family extracellular repeat protein
MNKTLWRLTVVALGAVLFLAAGADAAKGPPQYHFVDLGSDSHANGINSKAWVVGQSWSSATSSWHAFLWTAKGGMQDPGNLGGDGGTWANGINNKGQVVGASYLKGNTIVHAFLWTAKGGMQDLDTLGGTYGEAKGINSKGQVVGFSYPSGNPGYHAFLWTAKGGIQDLGVPVGGTNCYPQAINRKGQVVGNYDNGNGSNVFGFYWSQATGFLDLNTLVVDLPSGVKVEVATGISDKGVVVGYTNEGHACLLTPQ